jgi:hypothetical protein
MHALIGAVMGGQSMDKNCFSLNWHAATLSSDFRGAHFHVTSNENLESIWKKEKIYGFIYSFAHVKGKLRYCL